MFHNRVVDGLRAGDITDALGRKLPSKPPAEPPTEQPGATLDELLDVENYYNDVCSSAQRLVRWHYQWIIVHEFLPLVAGPAGKRHSRSVTSSSNRTASCAVPMAEPRTDRPIKLSTGEARPAGART
jgi:hypothetical protein